MKIHEYNQMMAYLTRPATRTNFTPGGPVRKNELTKVLTKAEITPSQSNFSKVMNDIGIKKDITNPQHSLTNPMYIEPTKKELKLAKKQWDINQLQSFHTGPGREAYELREKRIIELLQKGDKSLSEIKNIMETEFGSSSQTTIIKIKNRLNLKIPKATEKGIKNFKTSKIIKDLDILKNSKELNNLILKPNFNLIKDIPELEKIATKLLPKSVAEPIRRVGQLMLAYSGEDPELQKYVGKVSDDLIKASSVIKTKMNKSNRLLSTLQKIASEKRAASELGENLGFFGSQRKRLNEIISSFKKGLKIEVDEVKAIGGARAKTAPYNRFVQGLQSTVNQQKGETLDRLTQTAEINLQNATTKEEKIKIANKYNEKVKKFVKQANKNLLPGQLPVRAFKISFDKPSNTIKNKQAYTQYKKEFDDIFKKHKYSFEVPKDVMTSEQAKIYLKTNKGRKKTINAINTLLQSADKKQILKIRETLGCPRLYSSGGRVSLANGTDLLTCPMQKLAADPEGTLNKVGKAVPETRSPILDVLKKAGAPLAKWGGRAFVAAGPAFVMMETMDAAEKFREGEPAGQIAADAVSNLLLPGVGASYELAQKRKMMKDIASPSELAAMEKEDKLRYAKMLQEDPLRETDYGSMIEENISTPAEQLDRFNLEEKTTAAYDYNKEQRKEQRQEVQDQFFKNIREKADDYLGGSYTDTNEISLDDIVKSYYNEGGRVGFAKGPKDPSKRLFIKGLAALSMLPVVGKYFKLAPKAKQAAGVILEKAGGIPDWFQPFVNKVLKEGKDVTKTEAIADRQIVKRVDIEDATVDVHYDVATNDVRVEVVGGKTALDEPLQMQYKAPEVLEESGKKTKAQFEASESVPEGRQVGPDDYDIDLGENTTEVLDDLLSETDYLEGYATGKIRTPAEIKKAKERARLRNLAKEKPAEYLDEVMGPYDDTIPDDFYD